MAFYYSSCVSSDFSAESVPAAFSVFSAGEAFAVPVKLEATEEEFADEAVEVRFVLPPAFKLLYLDLAAL